MTVETFEVEGPLRFTDAASEHFRSSLSSAGKAAVRLSVQESGCTGFKYVMEEVDAGEDSDTPLALDNGVKVFIAADALEFLRGTEVDLSREGINKVLKFNNPNVVAECGCGESFSVG
ncbi:HesB/IscA family protein [Congregibacter litoralis]|uniref:Iron-sulfur cluster assembly accessory protein n=1 Tax=Congregibacter litoralis KT71 TaxID=314285 RepID=A4ABF5_9GAMM|nr:iron-sulfur cluster assembly accessory protein [Congregibacter litoralis]EAQ96709.2 Iron-sulfur cluster assembly accessory protein [Congregibacter litoralis KT71]